MQPLSKPLPTYRRQPPLLLSDGSQHCAAMVAPWAVVAPASSMQLAAGCRPAPPSSARTGCHAVGDALGDCVVGDMLGGAVLPSTVGARVIGEALGEGVVGAALGNAVQGSFVHTGTWLY